jgi:hypothetical protein
VPRCRRQGPRTRARRAKSSRRRSHHPRQTPWRRFPLRLRHQRSPLRPRRRRSRLFRHAHLGRHLPVHGQLQSGIRPKTHQKPGRLHRHAPGKIIFLRGIGFSLRGLCAWQGFNCFKVFFWLRLKPHRLKPVPQKIMTPSPPWSLENNAPAETLRSSSIPSPPPRESLLTNPPR